MSGTCNVEGCERARWARGMCPAHYARWWKATPPAVHHPYRPLAADGDDVDEIAVERVMRGDRSVVLTAAERVEVARRILAAGRPPTHVGDVLAMSGSSVRRFLAVNGLAS